ncbi:ABC transporter permease [Lactobacillus johnsonii]
MKKINAVFTRVIKEMLRDKRTLVLMLIAPLLIMTIINFLFSSSATQDATLGVQNVDQAIVKKLKTDHLKIKEISSNESARKIVKDNYLDGLLSQKDKKLTITLQNTDQSKKAVILQGLQKAQVKLKMQASKSVIKAQQKALKQMSTELATLIKTNPQLAAQINTQNASSLKFDKSSYKFKTKYLYGNKNTNYFDSLMPIMINFIVFFFVFLISGMSLFGERNRGTLGRILATPIRKIELIIGYILGYGLIAIVQTIEIVLFTIYIFKLEVVGNIGVVILINLLVAFVALSLGILLSAFANSEFQMMQMIPLVIIPQVFFSGIIPVDTMQNWLQWIAHLTPLYYASNSMLNVIQKGYNLMQIGPNCLILLLFGIIFMVGAVITMRKYREV